MLAAAFDSRGFTKACSVFNARSFPQFGELSVTHLSERVAFSPALFKPRLAIQPDASSSEKLSNISSDGLPSSTAHPGQTRVEVLPDNQFGSAISLIGEADTQACGGLQRQPMSAFGIKRTPHDPLLYSSDIA